MTGFGMKRKFRAKRRAPKGSLVKTMKRVAMSVINKTSEHKYLDTAIFTSYDFSGTTISLSDIPQGDTDSQRDGDKVLPYSLTVNLGTLAADTT